MAWGHSTGYVVSSPFALVSWRDIDGDCPFEVAGLPGIGIWKLETARRRDFRRSWCGQLVLHSFIAEFRRHEMGNPHLDGAGFSWH